MPQMRLVHIELKEANAFVTRLHRHHKPVCGHRFSLGACDKRGDLVGVCIVGRPVARMVNQRYVAEVTRLCTDGTKNACSYLYSAAARAARALGYKRIQTYTLQSESGTSLRATGWVCDGCVRKDGKGWNNRAGRRNDQPTEPKVRWHKELS